MEKKTKIKLLVGGVTAGAGAIWLSQSGTRINQGGLQVQNGQVMPTDPGGDPNAIVDPGGTEHQFGTYAGELAAYQMAVRFAILFGRISTAAWSILDPARGGELYADYITRRTFRVRQFCTEDEIATFTSLVQVGIAFGQSLRQLGYASCATGRLTTAGFNPMPAHDMRNIVYVGDFNPLANQTAAGTRSTGIVIGRPTEWILEGQRVIEAFIRAYPDLIPLTSADSQRLSADFHADSARVEQLDSGEAPTMGALAAGAAAVGAWLVAHWGTVAILLIVGATVLVGVVERHAFSTWLFGEAAMADELADRLEQMADCIADDELSAEVRAGCQQGYQAILDEIHSLQPAAPAITKWLGIAVIGGLGITGGYFALKARGK